MNEEAIDKTFIKLCEEADNIKCYGQPVFFITDKEYEEYLGGEIDKEEVRVRDGKTSTGIRRWTLTFIKNVLFH